MSMACGISHPFLKNFYFCRNTALAPFVYPIEEMKEGNISIFTQKYILCTIHSLLAHPCKIVVFPSLKMQNFGWHAHTEKANISCNDIKTSFLFPNFPAPWIRPIPCESPLTPFSHYLHLKHFCLCHHFCHCHIVVTIGSFTLWWAI